MNKKFSKMIKQREVTSGVVYSPRDLFRTYLIFEQTELSESNYSRVNKIQEDVDITKAFPMVQKKQPQTPKPPNPGSYLGTVWTSGLDQWF